MKTYRVGTFCSHKHFFQWFPPTSLAGYLLRGCEITSGFSDYIVYSLSPPPPQLLMISALIPERCVICLCIIFLQQVCFFYKIKQLAKSFLTECDMTPCQRLL